MPETNARKASSWPLAIKQNDAAGRRHQAIFASAIDVGLIAIDRDGLVTDWSSAAERIVGWSLEEMVGNQIDVLFTAKDRAEGRSQLEMECALKSGRSQSEGWHLRKDGTQFWGAEELVPLIGDDGELLGYLKTLTDWTERRQATEDRRADVEFLRSVLGASSDCIKVLDLDAKLVFMTEVGQSLMGVSDFNTVRGCFWPDFWKGKSNLDAKAAVEAARAGSVGRFQNAADTMTGTPRFWDVVVTPILDKDRKPEKLLVVSRDITATRDAEQAMRESEARFRNVADSAPALIWMTDSEGEVTFANKHFEHMFGRPSSDFLANNWEHAFPDEDIVSFRSALADSFKGHLPMRAEVRIRNKAGEVRWLRCDSVPRSDDGGQFLGYTGCAQDITAAKLAADELERVVANRTADLSRAVKRLHEEVTERQLAEEQLRQAQKMEAIGQLTGGLAHDFNNLLTGIIGSLELLKTRVSQGRVSEAGRYIGAAQSEAQRAAALTHRLLAFARRQTLDAQPTDANRLIAEMEDMIRRTVGPAIQIETPLTEGVWPTLCDHHQLENALLNLCINARDAMPDGGRLMIATENVDLDEAGSRERGINPGNYVAISVADTGTGMPSDVVAHAFEPFFTTKPTGQGTGLGLSMIYGFAKQSGGQARIASEMGKGTIVQICLPRHYGAMPSAKKATESGTLSRAERGETVLVVDDEPTIRMLVTEVLNELGYGVLKAKDGAAGLEILRSDVRIDLLVTDVGLPGGMNGRQMADAGRVVRPELKVLFVTGYAEHATVGDGMLEPGMEVMVKPFAMTGLAERIKVMLADR